VKILQSVEGVDVEPRLKSRNISSYL